MSATEVSALEAVSPKIEESKPWWRFPIVWLVIGGPLTVVIASLITAFVAAHGQDPVLLRDESAGAVEVRNGTESMTPAEAARNHAATPRQP
jgi:uncharacterized protein